MKARQVLYMQWIVAMGGTGLEPVASRVSSGRPLPNNDLNNKDLQNQEQSPCTKRRTLSPENSQKTTENQALNLSDDLAAIVNAWPELPVHIKAAIQAFIQAHKKAEKK